MARFWVSWWSGNYADEGCTKPPFQSWCSGVRFTREDERDEESYCAVIDTEDEGAEARITEEVDLILPTDLWELVKSRFHVSVNLLCPICIAQGLEWLGQFDYFNLVKLDTRAPVPTEPVGDGTENERWKASAHSRVFATAPAPVPEPEGRAGCYWKYIGDDDWQTSCGQLGGFSHNPAFRFCPFCGKKKEIK